MDTGTTEDTPFTILAMPTDQTPTPAPYTPEEIEKMRNENVIVFYCQDCEDARSLVGDDTTLCSECRLELVAIPRFLATIDALQQENEKLKEALSSLDDYDEDCHHSNVARTALHPKPPSTNA